MKIIILIFLTTFFSISCSKDKTIVPEIDNNDEIVVQQTIGVENILFFFGGQSNASSGNSANLLPAEMRKVLEGIFIWNQIKNRFEPYQAGVNSCTIEYLSVSSTAFGSEMQIAINHRLKTGKNIFIIKHAVGGVPLAMREDYDFNSESENEGCCDIILQINKAKKWLLDKKIEYVFDKFIWIHGEQDGKTELAAGSYDTNLKNFLDKIKLETSSSFNLILTRVATQRLYLDLIRSKIQTYIDLNPNDIMVDIDDVPLLKPLDGGGYDQTHYYWNEINVIGDKISAQMK